MFIFTLIFYINIYIHQNQNNRPAKMKVDQDQIELKDIKTKSDNDIQEMSELGNANNSKQPQ